MEEGERDELVVGQTVFSGEPKRSGVLLYLQVKPRGQEQSCRLALTCRCPRLELREICRFDQEIKENLVHALFS